MLGLYYLYLIKQKIMHNPVQQSLICSNNQLKLSSPILTRIHGSKELNFSTFRVDLGRDYHRK